MVEGTPLLREHARKNVHRRFESVRLRQNSIPEVPALTASPRLPPLRALVLDLEREDSKAPAAGEHLRFLQPKRLTEYRESSSRRGAEPHDLDGIFIRVLEAHG